MSSATTSPATTSPAQTIARLVGPLFVAIGLGVLLNRATYAAAIAEGVRSPVLVYLAGMGTMLAGLAILNAHHAWTADWRVIVTVLGWMFIIAGIVRIVLPTVATSLSSTIYSAPVAMAVMGIVVLAVGGYLSFEGYRR
jgi:hypothetical protein